MSPQNPKESAVVLFVCSCSVWTLSTSLSDKFSAIRDPHRIQHLKTLSLNYPRQLQGGLLCVYLNYPETITISSSSSHRAQNINISMAERLHDDPVKTYVHSSRCFLTVEGKDVTTKPKWHHCLRVRLLVKCLNIVRCQRVSGTSKDSLYCGSQEWNINGAYGDAPFKTTNVVIILNHLAKKRSQ